MNRVLVHEGEGVRLWKTDTASPAYLQQIASTVFGSSGTRYKRLDADSLAARLTGAYFFEAERDDRLIGTYLLARRPVIVDDIEVDSLYRGQLTVAADWRSRGLGRMIVRQALGWAAQSLSGPPPFSWGFVEDSNRRSIKALQSVGGIQLGSLTSMLTYRQFTRRHPQVTQLDDETLIGNAVRASHRDCALRPAGKSSSAFYGICHGEEIVAGARVNHVKINLAVTGRSWHRVYGALIDLLPPARRRFDPRNFQYIRLYDLVVGKDSGTSWDQLIADLMRRFGVHMAMFSLDPGSRSYAMLEHMGLFGRFAKTTRQSMRLVGICDAQKHELTSTIRSKPIALTPIDM